ncbi:MAG: ABC transporter ATP-binding protein [Microbacteriaceae bacterium]
MGWVNNVAIQLTNLTKIFGEKPAVLNLNLSVPKGSFFGLVGPNGAGKTTTLSMTTGLLRPTHGQALINGIDIWQEPLKAKAELGVLADGVKLFDRLTGRELVVYNGLLRGMNREIVDQRTAELLNALELTEDANKLVVDYSSGMTKKIALAAALIHAPKVLVLDEPFESVDPVSSAVIRSILHGYIQGGGTVVLSSHVMELVEKLCTHVAVIAQGQVLAAGPTAEVTAGKSLDERFVELVGGRGLVEGELSWLQQSQD